MASLLLRICSIIHFILALTVIIVQAVIIGAYTSETDPIFSQTGAGFWTGIILFAAGICLWLASKQSEDAYKIDVAALVLSVLALLASVAMIALASAVIYDIRTRFGYDDVKDPTGNPFVEFYEALDQRKILESVLLSCGIVAVVIDIASIVFVWISFGGSSSTHILPVTVNKK